jgi:hypothetical protein
MCDRMDLTCAESLLTEEKEMLESRFSSKVFKAPHFEGRASLPARCFGPGKSITVLGQPRKVLQGCERKGPRREMVPS